MAEYHGPERRSENRDMMVLLTSMDKNLALAVQKMEAGTIIMDKHITDDKQIQGELREGQTKINLKLSWYAGALAALIGACTLILKVGK